MGDYLVRVRDYNPKLGAHTRRCTVWGKRFDHERGWYRIKGEERAEELRAHKNKGGLIFEVKTSEEVKQMIRRENLDPTAAELVGEDQFREPREPRRKRPLLSNGETLHPATEGWYEDEESEDKEEAEEAPEPDEDDFEPEPTTAPEPAKARKRAPKKTSKRAPRKRRSAET